MLLQFGVLLVALAVAFGLLVEVALQCIGQVNASLVCQADEYKKHVGQLVAQVFARFALLKRLLAILA